MRFRCSGNDGPVGIGGYGDDGVVERRLPLNCVVCGVVTVDGVIGVDAAVVGRDLG